MQRVCTSRLWQWLLLITGMSLACISVGSDRGPIIPKGKGEHCVADTDFMRRNHMDLIIHQRDETVVRGIRDEPFSLVECVDCHVQRDVDNKPVRIDAEGQFCASCHSFVAVKIDCFGCHAAVPDVEEHQSVGRSHWLPDKKMLAFTLSKPALTKSAIGPTSDEPDAANSK